MRFSRAPSRAGGEDTSGEVSAAESGELGNLAGFAEIDAEAGGLVGPGDISLAGAELDRALPLAGREGVPPEAGAVRTMVTTVIASVAQER